jgi:hypothetical protein
MTVYVPDTWVILKLTGEAVDGVLYKVFAGWYGGFADGDRWKMNSGITNFTEYGEYVEFDGYSGSIYRANKHNETLSTHQHSVLVNISSNCMEEGVSIQVIPYTEFAKEFVPE